MTATRSAPVSKSGLALTTILMQRSSIVQRLKKIPIAIAISIFALIISLMGVSIDYFKNVYVDNCLIISSTQLLERGVDEDTTIGTSHLNNHAHVVYVSDLLLSNAGNRPLLIDGIHYALRLYEDKNAEKGDLILNPRGQYVDTYVDDALTSFALPKAIYISPGEVRSIRLKSLFDRSPYHFYKNSMQFIEVHFNVYSSLLARSRIGFRIATTQFDQHGFPTYPQRIEKAEFAKRHRWKDGESRTMTHRLDQMLAKVFSRC